MRKYIILSIIFFAVVNISFAQLRGQARIDSLIMVLPKMKEDTNAVKILSNLSFQYRVINPDEGIKYGEQGLKLAKKLSWKAGEADCYNSLGVNNSSKSDYPKALEYYHKALNINEELGNKSGVANNLGNLGVIYGSLSDYPKALEYYNKAYEINKELGRKINMSNNLGNIASVYSTLSNYPKALEYFLKSLKISEEISAEDIIAMNLGNIGILHHNQSEYTIALDYLYRALEINERLGRKLNMANNLGSIGQIYHDQSKYEKSLDYLQRSLTINEEIGNLEGVTNHLITMGLIFLKNKKYEKSLENFNGALKIFKEVGFSYGIGSIYGHISNWYLSQLVDSTLEKNEDYTNNAIEYGQKGLEILQELGELKNRSSILKTLSDVYTINSDFKKAYDTYLEYKKLADSIFTIDSKKAIANLETKRELDIKQKENENLLQKSELQHLDLIRKSQDMNLLNKEKEVQHLAFLKEQAEKQEKEKQLSLSETQMKLQQSQIETLDKDKEKQNAELKAKNLQRNFLIAGAIVFIILFLIAFIRFREKKKLSERLTKQKQEIEKQKQIVETQKSIVEEKNEQIVASITYASTIQHAILPWDSVLESAFSDILIFYKPKDIVSGDSYWFKEVEGIKFLAAIDCTGHGIPGAMLTVIASSVLDDAVLGKRLSDTAEILTYMNDKVTDVLNQRLAENQTRDGMEVALIAIHQDKIQFTGAGRPLYLKNGTMEIIKTDKRGIAGSAKNDEYNFTSIEIDKVENMTLFLTTDGFADQMNEHSKKYSTKRFVSLLENISDKPSTEQNTILEQEFNNHRSSREQIDDVTILGVKI